MQKKNSGNKIAFPERKKKGSSPGTLIYTGTEKSVKTKLKAIHYSADSFTEKEIKRTQINKLLDDENKITWLNVEGLNDTDIIEEIGDEFNLHHLLLEDVLNVYQIPKLDDYGEAGVLFITVNEFYLRNEDAVLAHDQMSLIIGKNYIITFQERPGDAFDPVRERIRNGKGRIRKKGVDYLAYALLDALVDSYYDITDRYNGELLSMENELIEKPKHNQLTHIHALSKNLITFRKSVAPVKDIINKLLKDEMGIVQEESKVYLRDLADHVNQIINTIDTDREYLTSLINTNLTNINNRMNEIMKVLTVISTIFIPLTFIVGVYGMNFDYLPELHWHYSYPVLWGVMVLMIIVQLIIFKRNKWL